MNYEHFISLSIPVLWSGKPITLNICSDLCRFPQGSSSFLHPAWTVWRTEFGYSHFGFAWSQWEEGTWKQTPVRPETPNWFTLALLLAGVSSGLRTAKKEKAFGSMSRFISSVSPQLYHYLLLVTMAAGCLISRHWSRDHICRLRHRLPVKLEGCSNLKTMV